LSASDDQSFDAIEAIELGFPLGHARQIPTRPWSRTAATDLSVEHPRALQDAPDGAQRW
jgi:hypothetical protein